MLGSLVVVNMEDIEVEVRLAQMHFQVLLGQSYLDNCLDHDLEGNQEVGNLVEACWVVEFLGYMLAY